MPALDVGVLENLLIVVVDKAIGQHVGVAEDDGEKKNADEDAFVRDWIERRREGGSGRLERAARCLGMGRIRGHCVDTFLMKVVLEFKGGDGGGLGRCASVVSDH